MSFTSRARWLLVLTFFAFMQGWALRRWVLTDTRTLAWDQAIHTGVAFQYQDRFAHEGISRLFRPVLFDYPPLYHLSLIPALHVVDDIADAGALINFFYLCVLLLSVFLIGEHLMGVWEGGTAAILAGCYPVLMDLSRQTLIDYSLTALVALSFLCLIKSDNFSRLRWASFFGVSLALAMLTKWTALAYLLGPLIPALWRGVRAKRYKAILCSVGFFAALIFPWYIQNVIPMMSAIAHLSGLPPASGTNMEGLAKVFWYALALIEQLNLSFLLLFLPGLAAVFWRPKMTPVFLWFIVSLFLFSLINNKNVRYTAPALPAAALLSVAWLPFGKKIPLAVINLVAVTFFIIFNFFPTSRALGTVGSQPIWLIQSPPPAPGDWQHGPVIDRIHALKASEKPIAHVTVVSNYAHFHSTTLDLSARVRKISDVAFFGVRKTRWFEFADFILFKTGDIGPVMTGKNVRDCADFIQNPPAWFLRTYKETDRWPLPDGSEAVLYRCSPDPQKIPDVGIFNLSLDKLELKNVVASGVELKATPISASQTHLGKLRELRVSCKAVEYKGIRFDDVRIRLHHPQVNLPLFLEMGEIRLNSLMSLELHATVDAASLIAYAERKAKWLKEPAVSFEGTVVRVSGKAGGVPLELAADVRIEDGWLKTRLLKMKIAHIPIPLVLVRNLSDRDVDLRANADRTYELSIDDLRGTGTRLRLGS